MKDKPMLIMRYGRAIAAMALVALLTPALPACEQYEYMPIMEPERDEDTFRIGILEIIHTLHPHRLSPPNFTELNFDPLGHPVATSSVDYQYVKSIVAESVKYNFNRSECIISIRKGMLFHNGEEITSEHVVSSLKMAPNYSNNHLLKLTYTIIDKYNIKVVSNDKWVTWDELFTTSIINTNVNTTHEPGYSEENNIHPPVGSGPYRFIRYDIDKQIIFLERWDKYWAGFPKYKHIEIHRFNHSDALIMALLDGRIDFASDINFQDIEMLSQSDNIDIYNTLYNFYGRLTINGKRKHLADPRIRRALSLLIDRELLVKSKKGLNGAGVATDTIFNYIRPYTIPTVIEKQNIKRAYELFSEAGYTKTNNLLERNGEPFTIKLLMHHTNSMNTLGTIRMIAQMWNEAGIQTSIISLEFEAANKKLFLMDYDVLFNIHLDNGFLNSATTQAKVFDDLLPCCEIDTNMKYLKLYIEKINNNENHIDLLDAKMAFQKSIRDTSTVLPLYYLKTFVAIRKNKGKIDAAFKLDPFFLAYQARPSLVR